jgi:HlyD family secretion protein
MNMKNTTLWLLAAVLIGLAACGGKKAPVYEFTEIKRGSLERTVSSTGTLNPVSTVKVLPRMSGKVEKVLVDYNDEVKAGQTLAVLNTDMLRLQREQQNAQVIKSRANYNLQKENFRSQEILAEKGLISEYELKTGRTNLDVLAAELSSAEASLKSIDTEINQYAYITSPIDGIVLERNISAGDTVVDSSSSNSSSIFTLAENLSEMQIESWVGELDISSIKEGQEVRFTLESLPGKNFSGSVQSKRLMPQVQDSVVSYDVIISVDNSEGLLLPGMSCSVEFIEEKSENVLYVPNAALRYTPTSLTKDEISEKQFNASLTGLSEEDRKTAIAAREEALKKAAESSGDSSSSGGLASIVMPGRMPGMGGPPGQRGGSGGAQSRSGGQTVSTPKALWYVDNAGKPECFLVFTGVSDGVNTEVRPAAGGTNLEGLKIILKEQI